MTAPELRALAAAYDEAIAAAVQRRNERLRLLRASLHESPAYDRAVEVVGDIYQTERTEATQRYRTALAEAFRSPRADTESDQ